jgi:Sulfotransferase family
LSAENPEMQARESLSTRWLHARTARDFAAAEDLSLQLLRRYPNHESIRRGWARTLAALDREDEAAPHWRVLLEANACDLEAANHVVRGGRSCGHAFRHVAICGISFCGSTVMDRLLGGLPGAANICESHWLTQMRSPAGHVAIEFNSPDSAVRHCARCGSDCAVLNGSFRQALARDATDWYAKIAVRLDTHNLVSADKNAAKLVDLDPLLRFDALVLFKDPIQAWMSARRKLPEGRGAEFYRDACIDYLALWADRYSTFLDHFHPQGKLLFLQFDEFARKPAELLKNICGALDLAFYADVFEAPRQGHPIGGNTLYADRADVRIAPLAGPDCPDDEFRLIAEAGRAQAVFRRLLERTEISLLR